MVTLVGFLLSARSKRGVPSGPVVLIRFHPFVLVVVLKVLAHFLRRDPRRRNGLVAKLIEIN